MAEEDLGKLFPPVSVWYLFSRANSRSFSWNTGRIWNVLTHVFRRFSDVRGGGVFFCYLQYLLEHLQRERPVLGQPLALLGSLLAKLPGLLLQSRNLFLHRRKQQPDSQGEGFLTLDATTVICQLNSADIVQGLLLHLLVDD